MPASPYTKRRLTAIRRILAQNYPDPQTPLAHADTWQLLVAVMLSAQTTDVLVNKITPALFARYPTVEALAVADVDDVAQLIARVNYYRTKARHLIATARMVRDNCAGRVPSTMEELLRLPGVARKTANVVLSEGFNAPVGIVVDTHVARVAYRLGLTTHTAPQKVEKDLLAIIPKKEWRAFPLRLIFHGRETCIARCPRCSVCPLFAHCPRLGVVRSS